MKSLAFPVDFSELPVVAFRADRGIIHQRLGPPPVQMPDPSAPGPQILWAFEYPCGLQVVWQVPDGDYPVHLAANSTDPEHVLAHVDIPVHDIWQEPSGLQALGAERWQLWRQDDNGSRHLIQVFRSKAAAECSLAGYESRHHKQTYWLHDRSLD